MDERKLPRGSISTPWFLLVTVSAKIAPEKRKRLKKVVRMRGIETQIKEMTGDGKDLRENRKNTAYNLQIYILQISGLLRQKM